MIEWFDDLTLGMRFKSGEVSVSKEDIKRFAAEFDPQPFHLDEAAAEKTVFKALAASGWHTAAISMGLTVEVRPFGPHPLMGLGVDDLRWMLPVRPGDVQRRSSTPDRKSTRLNSSHQIISYSLFFFKKKKDVKI